MIHEILKEINKENGSNYKLSVLRKYKDNELLKRVLAMTYDKVTYTYGIRKTLDYVPSIPVMTLNECLNFLERSLITRNITGNDALEQLRTWLMQLTVEDADIIKKILKRDLRINCGRTLINKVWPGLIVKPPYMRCAVYSDKTASKISFPAIVQQKADGRFCYVIKEDDKITFMSRTGEEAEFPILEHEFKHDDLLNGVYAGELLVRGIPNRQKANGLINSDDPPHDDIVFQCWDYIRPTEFAEPKHTDRNLLRIKYETRFKHLSFMVNLYTSKTKSHISLIPSTIVNNIQEALVLCSNWMNEGFEGAILKDKGNVFKDHTAPTQLKLKLEIDADMRIIGFSEGTPGTKREATFGAIMYENDEGTVKGQCSGFTDVQLEDFNNRREELIGKIITVQFNDLSKAENSDTYALNHPRFIEIRNDKNETDTLERLFELKNMAACIS